ncbi:MAG: site-specific DNA-methyltransferase [Planctomycetota bacterium]
MGLKERLVAVLAARDRSLTLDVEPRKPRLAWQGMDRREAAVSVPTQVVEIVRPGKAVAEKDILTGFAAGKQAARAQELPENRLIWTNDNLVALQTLLDERDPATKDYRYRGKVDLVYIDPPFMVNNDFLADNAIDIDLDADEEVAAKKEPSLVEILAYKDTWRQGLDSFLSMLRARLVVLKDLLAPTGSIYVHLDWHAVHYVKVLMDDVFGYECFLNEVVWKRTGARSDSKGFNHVHDSLLSYSGGGVPWTETLRLPHEAAYVRSHFGTVDERGRRYQPISLTPPGTRNGETGRPWRGIDPTSKGMHWKYQPAELDRLDAAGMIYWPTRGEMPRLKMFIDESEGVPMQSIWTDIPAVNSQASERLGYPTQKPVDLLSRLVRASCPPGGIVLDCFVGSGTTAEAAERLERRWIGIDNGKYAIHLTRKRLIQLHGEPKPPEKEQSDYVECDACKNIERKVKPQKSRETFRVRPFTVENMGVYQRAEQWQDFQTQRTRYRDEMVRVFGGEVVNDLPLLHGRKGNSWVHIGPLDAPVSSAQVWSIAREAQRTTTKSVTILSADFDTLSASDKDDVKAATGVAITVRVIPASAIDEVRRRLEIQRDNPDAPIESMAVPAFYAPLSIRLSTAVSGRLAKVTLERCEVDIESFLASQRPLLKPITDSMSAAAKKKAQAEAARWAARQKQLEQWLAKATSWQSFVDFWAVDWDHCSRLGTDDKPIFETDWQSFRVRRSKKDVDPLVFTAEYKYQQPGRYRVAARVTDVFGNDGIATATIEVK